LANLKKLTGIHVGQPDTCRQFISACFRGVAIFAKAFMGIPAQQAAKATRPLMPAAAPVVLLHSLDTQQGVSNIILAMTRRDFGKPAFSLRKKRFVKTHALSLLGTTRLLSRSGGYYVRDRSGGFCRQRMVSGIVYSSVFHAGAPMAHGRSSSVIFLKPLIYRMFLWTDRW